MNKEKIMYKFEFKKEANPFLVLLFSVCLLFELFFVIMALMDLDFPFQIDLIFLLLVIGFVATNSLLWQIRGKEILTITTKEIKISKRGKIFKTGEKVNISDVKKVTCERDRNPLIFKTYFFIEGPIKIYKKNGYAVRFGVDCSEKEAQKIVEDINQIIENIRGNVSD
jgi:hypothetical protein